MKNRKNKIAALTLAASMLLSATGCTPIKRTISNENKIVYSGSVNSEDLENLYVVEINDLKKEKQLYLTKKIQLLGGSYRFNLLGTETIILELTKEKEIITSYGKIENIISFSQFIATYGEIKEYYNAEEIINIFEAAKKDYEELMKNDNVKKLELK